MGKKNHRETVRANVRGDQRELLSDRVERTPSFHRVLHLGGGTNPFRIIKRLESWERRYELVVDKIPDDYFETLAGAAENVTCIHFEPFGFQVSTNNPISKGQEKFVHDRHWNTNFVQVLEKSRANKMINVEFLATDLFAIDKSSPTSIAIWQN